MGLDVYLYHCPDLPAVTKAKAQYEAETEGFWKKYCDPNDTWKQIPKDEQDTRYATYKAEMARVAALFGLDADGEHPSNTKIEEPSAKYPEHYFKVGYFRSSYNDSGINNVMRRLGLPDLYHVMEPGEQYEFTPDWKACRERAEAVLSQYRAADTAYDVIRIGMHLYTREPFCSSQEEALRIFREQRGREHSDGSYSNGKGDFFMEGITVRAVIMGAEEDIIGKVRGQSIQQPCAYIVYDKPDSAWYAQALEIVIETCDYVLDKPDPENHYVHWSS